MQTYTIREISELFSLPASTLRYYESEGLLPNVEKSSSGQRIYTEEHIERLNCINCFKRTGMTIPQLRKFFEYGSRKTYVIVTFLGILEMMKMGKLPIVQENIFDDILITYREKEDKRKEREE